jgi:hypothetical protein
MKKGLVVELSTNPHEWKHGLAEECHPEVPQGPADPG